MQIEMQGQCVPPTVYVYSVGAGGIILDDTELEWLCVLRCGVLPCSEHMAQYLLPL